MLKGIRVIELATVITGPLAGKILTDFGADVIKVENPRGGDPFRNWQGGEGDAVRPVFSAFNSGKRSVALDLQSDGGVDAFMKLVGSAHVLITNWRPEALIRRGLDWAQLSKQNSSLVYCAITGPSSDSSDSNRPFYDAVAQAESGLWSQLSGQPGFTPVGPPIADQLTGIYAALGIVSALSRALSTGKGAKIEASMIDSCLAFQLLSIAEYADSGRAPGPASRARNSLSFAFTDIDSSPFTVHLSSQEVVWQRFCRAMNKPELISDGRFLTKRDRSSNYEDLAAECQRYFSDYEIGAILAKLRSFDIPCARILNLKEACDDGDVGRSSVLVRDPGTNEITGLVRSAVLVDGERPQSAGQAPKLGQDSRQLLRSLGYAPKEIDRLLA